MCLSKNIPENVVGGGKNSDFEPFKCDFDPTLTGEGHMFLSQAVGVFLKGVLLCENALQRSVRWVFWALQ